jgi:Family of unknown function (DUF6455)
MHDLCYSRRVLRQTGLMDHMMERLRVNPVFAAGIDGGLAWHEARTKCIFCPNVERCHDWLEGSEPLPSPGAFCPNTEFFRDCYSEILRHRGVVPTD